VLVRRKRAAKDKMAIDPVAVARVSLEAQDPGAPTPMHQ
jgi:hypothetical protein